jgi:hypothetical protein
VYNDFTGGMEDPSHKSRITEEDGDSFHNFLYSPLHSKKSLKIDEFLKISQGE